MPKIPITTQNLNPNVNYNSQSGAVVADVAYQPVFVDMNSRNAEFSNLAKIVPGNSDIEKASDYLYEYNKKLEHAETRSTIEGAKLETRKKLSDYMMSLEENPNHETYLPGLEKLYGEMKASREEMKTYPEARNAIGMNDAEAFTEASIKVKAFANRRRVDKLRADGWAQFSEYVKTGDVNAAANVSRGGVQDGWLTPAEGVQWKEKAMPMYDVFSVEKEIAANPAGAEKLLSERTDNGVFTNFKNLSLEQREHLINASKSEVKRRQELSLEALDKALYDGKLTEEMINGAVAGNVIKASDGLALRKKVLNPEKKAFEVEAYEKLESAFNDFQNEKIDRREMLKTFAECAGKLPDKYTSHIWDNIEEIKQPENLKQSFTYKAGKELIEKYHKDKKLYSDPSGMWNKRNRPEDQAINKVRFEKSFDEFFKNNPKATPEQAVEFVKTGLKHIQDDMSIEAFTREFAPAKRTSEAVSKSPETKDSPREIKRMYQGRTAVFDAETKKFIRFEN